MVYQYYKVQFFLKNIDIVLKMVYYKSTRYIIPNEEQYKKEINKMGYLTVKQFSEKWGISERRIIKLCKEERINGARKNGMVWEIPEETIKPSDRRSNIYKYINTEKRIMIVNVKKEIKGYLLELLEKEGYIAEFRDLDSSKNDEYDYYEGLIYFAISDKEEEKYIKEFSKKLNSESSIVVVDYKKEKRNKIETKLANKLKDEIGLKINTLILDINEKGNQIINYNEIAEDIIELLIRLKNTTGTEIITDGGKIEFNENDRTENMEIGKFYKAINNCFKRMNKESHLWCASTMLEDEWTESAQEMKFRQINLEAANVGVNVERIFIFSKDKIKEFKQNKTLKIYMLSNIKTLFVDYDEIKEKEPELLEIVKDGWDGIDKNILIVDLPETSKERGYISKNTKEVTRAYNCFQKLKTYSKSLKEALK